MKLSKLTKPELEEIYKNANFTEEEEEIYHLLCRGKTIKEISQKNTCMRSHSKQKNSSYQQKNRKIGGR